MSENDTTADETTDEVIARYDKRNLQTAVLQLQFLASKDLDMAIIQTMANLLRGYDNAEERAAVDEVKRRALEFATASSELRKAAEAYREVATGYACDSIAE